MCSAVFPSSAAWSLRKRRQSFQNLAKLGALCPQGLMACGPWEPQRAPDRGHQAPLQVCAALSAALKHAVLGTSWTEGWTQPRHQAANSILSSVTFLRNLLPPPPYPNLSVLQGVSNCSPIWLHPPTQSFSQKAVRPGRHELERAQSQHLAAGRLGAEGPPHQGSPPGTGR